MKVLLIGVLIFLGAQSLAQDETCVCEACYWVGTGNTKLCQVPFDASMRCYNDFRHVYAAPAGAACLSLHGLVVPGYYYYDAFEKKYSTRGCILVGCGPLAGVLPPRVP